MNGSGDANKKKLQVLKMPWRHLRIKNLHKSDPLSLPKEKKCQWLSFMPYFIQRRAPQNGICIFILLIWQGT